MDSQKQQIVEKLQAANNILLTVSRDPSVDQLAACIALTILLNKMDKHATAVFSGKIPSTIDFLKPDETLEKNTDSLRDFIIALDKSKADKLRYKVEDRVVKIFITPYKTSLTSDDLEFSQGDFNVDVVLALGVHQQADLDDAITAHGRILHDATVMCINTSPNGDLGGVNWVGQNASSLSELATELAKSFEKPQLDEQIATALLTGIVAETNRFKNDKTTATTMSLSADLMKAGANQQLVADELEQTVRVRDQQGEDTSSKPDEATPPKGQDGTLEINHPADTPTDNEGHNGELPPLADDDNDDRISLDDTLDFSRRTMLPDSPEESKGDDSGNDEPDNDAPRSLITEPPTFGAALTANTQPDNGDLTNIGMPASEPEGPLIERENHIDKPADATPERDTTPPPSFTPKKTSFEPVFTPPTPPEPPAKPEPPVPTPTPEPPTTAPVTIAPAPFVPPKPAMPEPSAKPFLPPTPSTPPPPAPIILPEQETLTELEEAVKSPHVEEPESKEQATSDTSEIDKARDEVMRALSEQPSSLPPIEALNAHPVDLGKDAPTPELPAAPAVERPVTINPPEQAPFSTSPADKPMDMPLPPSITLPPAQTQPPTDSPTDSPDPPPQVPPPFLPGNFGK